MKTLEQVLADTRGEIPVLRRHGQHVIADAIERLCDDVQEAAQPFMRWLSESEAQLRSHRSTEWLRKRFAGWERMGLARWNPHRPTQRQYLECAIPQDLNLDAVRADAAREAARQAS